MKARWLALLGLLAFAWTAFWHAPADRLYAAWQARSPGAASQLHGVHGTLASGGAAALSVAGRPRLANLDWNLHPGWLLLLRLNADLQVRGDPAARFTLSRGVFGRLHLDDVELGGSIKGLLATVGAPPLPMEGRVTVALDTAQFADGLPVQVDGQADLQGLSWTLAREPMLLGDFHANLTTDDKGVLVQLASGPGPLEVSGEVRLLPDRNWDSHLQVKPRPGASPQVLALVRSMGDPDNAGWYHLRRRGTL